MFGLWNQLVLGMFQFMHSTVQCILFYIVFDTLKDISPCYTKYIIKLHDTCYAMHAIMDLGTT